MCEVFDKKAHDLCSGRLWGIQAWASEEQMNIIDGSCKRVETHKAPHFIIILFNYFCLCIIRPNKVLNLSNVLNLRKIEIPR